MKYVRQFAVIMLITCIGEILKYLIPLPVPASIYGLCLMLFLCLHYPHLLYPCLRSVLHIFFRCHCLYMSKVASIALSSALRSPFSSNAATPRIVTPPGEQT